MSTGPPDLIPQMEPANNRERDLLRLESLLLLGGDLSKLSPSERLLYYQRLCQSLGVNPLTRPFEYLQLKGKLVLYAKKDLTEQLRARYRISVTALTSETRGDVYLVTATAQKGEGGHTDLATGAVSIKGLAGDDLANAYMKAETKAKRRVTLSICGLGLLDESELDTVADDARVVPVDAATGALPDEAPGEAPTSAELTVSDYTARFEEATTREEAEEWRLRWTRIKHTIPEDARATVDAAIQRARARLRTP